MHLYLAIALGLTLLIHWPLTFQTILLDRDDRWLTAPLKDTRNFTDWWTAIRSGELPDLQPVRDLTYWIDWRLHDLLGSGPYFHLTNLMLWWGILALTWGIAGGVLAGSGKQRPSIADVLVVLMALHPVAVEPVAWVSGRKHLLSIFFMLLATRVLMNACARRKVSPASVVVISIAYLASCMSQPINVLWPVWAAVWLFVKQDRDWRQRNRVQLGSLAAALITGTVVTFMINMSVYQGTEWFGFKLTPHAQIHGTKLGGFRTDEIGISMLAIGRYFYNILCPFTIAHRYSPGAMVNLAGLLAIPLAGWMGWRLKAGRTDFFLWTMHAALPLLVVTAQLSAIFVADSYAASAMPGCLIAIALLYQGAGLDRRKSGLFAAVFGGMLLASSMSIAKSWTSTQKLWFRANAIEPTADSLYFTGGFLLQDGRFDEALDHATRLLATSGINSKSSRLITLAICSHPRIPDHEKIERFLALGISDSPPVVECIAGIRARKAASGKEQIQDRNGGDSNQKAGGSDR